MSSSDKTLSDPRILNINIGIVGHVDSGKTSLAKALTQIRSTASLDKHPQSRQRGITLDLGFSAFLLDIPPHLKDSLYDKIQITLVDCPGHASLVRTIIGGAQIIDSMILVIDVTKGIQTQTAECLVIGEITTDKMIVVLNKIDLFPEEEREANIQKVTKQIQKALSTTKFASSPIIPLSANVASSSSFDSESVQTLHLNSLLSKLSNSINLPPRNPSGSFLFSVDHCFLIKGKGTVMTGTVLSGSVSVNDTVEVPSMRVTKKVKGLQMFKKSIQRAVQGDRVGMLVTQFDHTKSFERGLVATPGIVKIMYAAIAKVDKVRYYKGDIKSHSKFHVTVGHETTIANVSFFSSSVETPVTDSQSPEDIAHLTTSTFNFSDNYLYESSLGQQTDQETDARKSYYALIEFDHPCTGLNGSLIIGSKLDIDIHINTCRLAFHGHILHSFTNESYKTTTLSNLKIYKWKSRIGSIDRVVDNNQIIGSDLFKKTTNMDLFLGMRVEILPSGQTGTIESRFGTSGKFVVNVPDGIHAGILEYFNFVARNAENMDHDPDAVEAERKKRERKERKEKKKKEKVENLVVAVNGEDEHKDEKPKKDKEKKKEKKEKKERKEKKDKSKESSSLTPKLNPPTTVLDSTTNPTVSTTLSPSTTVPNQTNLPSNPTLPTCESNSNSTSDTNLSNQLHQLKISIDQETDELTIPPSLTTTSNDIKHNFATPVCPSPNNNSDLINPEPSLQESKEKSRTKSSKSKKKRKEKEKVKQGDKIEIEGTNHHAGDGDIVLPETESQTTTSKSKSESKSKSKSKSKREKEKSKSKVPSQDDNETKQKVLEEKEMVKPWLELRFKRYVYDVGKKMVQ